MSPTKLSTPAMFFAARLLAACLLLLQVAHAQKPDVFLLKKYDGSQDVVGWVMSEKLDGVRGLWDGRQLLSRNGNTLHAPEWFIRDLPPFALDGELWTERGDFENIVSIVRRKTPDDRWAQVGYHIFEAPHQAGGLLERLAVLGNYLKKYPVAHLKIIPQIEVEANAQLGQFLNQVTASGGEGVVVRDPAPPYSTGRLPSALKVKKYLDAECTVRKILPGKGKYTGLMGALQCELADGGFVNIGSGFSDRERTEPPPVGGVITFKYYGLTKNGKPRFPVYLRRRQLFNHVCANRPSPADHSVRKDLLKILNINPKPGCNSINLTKGRFSASNSI